jgi:hypothetical protein
VRANPKFVRALENYNIAIWQISRESIVLQSPGWRTLRRLFSECHFLLHPSRADVLSAWYSPKRRSGEVVEAKERAAATVGE